MEDNKNFNPGATMKNKAMNFLEYVKLRMENNGDYFEFLLNEYGQHNEIKKALFFYSQPFSSDLIEKYFEGAVNGKHNGYVYYGKQGVFHFDDIHTYYHILTIALRQKQVKQVMLPVTLDNFITDCIRAGVELTFNQSALNQLNLK